MVERLCRRIQEEEVGDKVAALGDDAKGVVQVAEEGEELALGAGGSEQVVGEEESDVPCAGGDERGPIVRKSFRG